MNKFLGYLFYAVALTCFGCGFLGSVGLFSNGLIGAIKSFQALNYNDNETKLNFVGYVFELGLCWIPMLIGAIGSRIWSELAENRFKKS